MKINGAVIKEQGITFAIVMVQASALQTAMSATEARKAFQPLFPRLPLVLAAHDSRGRFEYQGRNDLVRFLASIDADRIPWKEYTIFL
ncbi:hypothetical protein HDG33_006002 [Paraburkholderia sp. Cpub6]|nr:hypothetical protein [Paraburkholderia sp. Cpub6]